MTSVTVTGQGRYDLDGERIVFTPEAGFIGTATPVTYRVADTRGTEVTATFTPTVRAAAASDPSAAVPAGPARGSLPQTGVDASPLWAIGATALALLGAGAYLVRRRRRAA